MIETHLPAIIALTFVAFSILIPVFGIWKEELSQPLAVLGSGIAAFFSVYGFFVFLDVGMIRYPFGGWAPPIGIEFVYDGLSAFFLLVINVVTLSLSSIQNTEGGQNFPAKRCRSTHLPC